MSNALVVDDVYKTFGATTAVGGLSFTAAQGEILALLGPNGAGKTTTINMCEGFASPTSGSISVLGIDPARDPEQVRSRVGIMLQGGGAYSGIRVREMLELSARYSLDPLDPDWLLELLGLHGVEKTTYRRLSGGQQQRLSLGLALIGRPEVVFLDEPTAGMDAQSRHVVWEIINALRRDGVSVILTTHLMEEAESLADSVVIIDHGALVAQGTPAELMHQDAATTMELHTNKAIDVNALNKALESHQLQAVQVNAQLYRLVGTPSPEGISALATEALHQNVLIHDYRAEHRSLEDVFLDLTGREMRS